MKTKKLQSFGKEFIQETRDETIEKYYKILKGDYNTEEAKYIRNILSKTENHDNFDKILIEFIDNYMSKLLFFFESNEDWAIVERQKAEESNIETLDQMSDGLSGELYSEDGWIAKYSKYKQIDDWLE